MKDKQFIKYIENKAKKTIKSYSLINKNDEILVACSGGKDSTVALYLMNKFFKNVEALTINTFIGDYSKKNLENIRSFCFGNNIKLHEVSFKEEFGHSLCYLHSVLNSRGLKLRSCTVCGVLKRNLLNRYAKKLKKTKLVTGHNLDDEVQSVFINFLRNNLSLSSRLGPITGLIKDKGFVARVKPLYFCYEKEIEKFSKLLNFNVIYEKCPCSVHAYRNVIRNLLNEYEKKFSGIKKNIICNFLKNQQKIKGFYSSHEKMVYCKRCNEPTKTGICNVCRMLS